MSPLFWMNLRERFDLERESERLEDTLAAIQLLPAVRAARSA